MKQSYKEKYEDILARLERAKNDDEVCDERFCCVIDDLIPELAESEDEKIKHEIKVVLANTDFSESALEYTFADMIAWLEKQGQVKESTISQHEIETCKENNNSLTSEDEKMIESLIESLTRISANTRTDSTSPNYSFYREIDWLKSLRPQSKQEWSEEDEQHIDSLLKRLDALCRNKFERTRFAISEDRDWLKSLRPQNRWKPSDEHIGLLQAIINEPNNAASESCQIVLKGILEQLKKLKEEQV